MAKVAGQWAEAVWQMGNFPPLAGERSNGRWVAVSAGTGLRAEAPK